MKGNRAKNTGPELRLRQQMQEIGLSGYRLNWKHAPGRPDLAFPQRKIAVFVHGCYWHRCPTCDYPLPKTNRVFWRRKFFLNRRRDARKRLELVEAGWRVFELWECYFKPSRRRKLSGALRSIAAAYLKEAAKIKRPGKPTSKGKPTRARPSR